MKKKIVVLVAVCCSFLAYASGDIHFAEGKWDAIKAQAKKENKFIFLDSYTDWCYWCKVMDKETFADTSVSNFINKNFISIKREMEKDEEGIAMSMKYHVNGFPTYLIFSPEGVLVYKVIGYRPAADFLGELNKSLATTTGLYPGMGAQLDPGFPQFYKESFGTSKKRKYPALKTVTDFLDAQKDLFSEVSWSVMWRFELNEKYENWILGNKENLASLYGKEEVDNKIAGIISIRVDRAGETKNQEAFDAALVMTEKYLPEQYEDLSVSFSLDFYLKTGNWKMYSATVQKHISKSGYSNPGFINSVSWTIYEQCPDAGVLKESISWMDSVCAKFPEYAYLDTYAALLYKDGQYKKAEEFALKAIDAGKAIEEDVSATEALLANIRLKIK